MRWKIFPKTDCERIVATLPQSFKEDELDSIHLALRQDLKEISTSVLAEDPGAKEYSYDLAFAVPFYEIMTKKYGMTERYASNDGIWRYLSVKVVPDIVLGRWGHRDARFWKESRRIWLKALWWYIHLSWQGNAADTLAILKDNTADVLVQLVERPGPQGYRVDVSREIMKKLASVSGLSNRATLFRKIMVLNTARLKVIEPALCNEGVAGYVRQLFIYFDCK